jgi:Family of unknown function (DUF5320)
MPGFNGTGPMGMGSRTGGGFGYCAPGAGPAMPVNQSAYYGVGRGGYPRGGGRGRAWGGGRGFGRGNFPGTGPGAYYQPYAGPAYSPAPAAERGFLEQQARGLQDELDAVRQRLDEIEKTDKPEADAS